MHSAGRILHGKIADRLLLMLICFDLSDHFAERLRKNQDEFGTCRRVGEHHYSARKAACRWLSEISIMSSSYQTASASSKWNGPR
jgi:hypothetical protein